MMTKQLLLLVALTLCIVSLDALPRQRCLCIRTTWSPVPVRVIANITVHPISGSCRRTEVVVTRKNGSKFCVNPEAEWFKSLLNNERNSQTTDPPTASTINY